MKKYLSLALLIFASVTALGAQTTQEDRDYIIFENNGFIFASYLRAGAMFSYEGALVEGGNPWNVTGGYNGMRFMNEANYNEWLLGYESDREEGSWWGGAYLRVAFDIPDFSAGWLNISDDTYGIVLPEAFFRMGFTGKDWNLWIGRRYNDKVAVGMMDYYIANLDGNGGGVENISLGAARLDAHWLFSYDNGDETTDMSVASDGDAFIGKQTLALYFKDIAVGDHSLGFIVAPSVLPGNTTNDGDTYDTTAGGFVTVKYNRSCFFGLDGSSETYASVGFGSGANQAVDTNLGASDWYDWSVFAGFQGSGVVNDTFSFKASLHYEHRSYDASVNDFLSFGLRPMIMLAPIFGLQFEYDLEAAITTGAMVNRITFAPTFTPPGGNVNSGVQVMPYITWGYGEFQGGDTIAIGSTDHGLTFGIFGHVGF